MPRDPRKLLEDIHQAVARIEQFTPNISGQDYFASELLQSALQTLSPDLRETVILRDLEELEYREIAQVLNVPEGTVKSRLARARSALRQVLEHDATARPSGVRP